MTNRLFSNLSKGTLVHWNLHLLNYKMISNFVLQAIRHGGNEFDMYLHTHLKFPHYMTGGSFFKQGANSFKFASKTLKNDKEVVLEAVKREGYALQYASKNAKKW